MDEKNPLSVKEGCDSKEVGFRQECKDQRPWLSSGLHMNTAAHAAALTHGSVHIHPPIL